MASPFLALNTRDGGTPQARRYVNTTASAVGVAFGVIDNFVGSPYQGRQRSRIIQFGGDDNTWIATVGTGIYRTTDAGASWTLVQTLALIHSENIHKTGIYVFDFAGVPTAVMAYFTTTTTQYRSYQSTDGITWRAAGPFTVLDGNTSNGSGISYEHLFNNSLWFLHANSHGGNTRLNIFTPGAGAMSSTNMSNDSNNHCSALVTWNNAVYMLRADNAGVCRLYDVTTGVLSVVATLEASGVQNVNGNTTHYAAWVDPDTGDLACAYYLSTTSGWKIQRIYSGTLVIEDVTSTVRPVALSGTAGGGNAPLASGIRPSVDEEGAAGAAAPVTLYYSANQTAGTTFTQWAWNGFGAVMTSVSSGGNVAHAMGIANRGGLGPLTWTASTLRVRPIFWTGQGVQGGVRIDYRLYGPLGNEAVKVRAFRRLAAEPHTRFPCTLRDPSAVQVERFTTSGSWLCPAGVNEVTVECWGGGGGSKADYGGGGSQGGGGGGAYARSVLVVTPGNSYNYVVGAGGAGGPKDTLPPASAQPGGDTYFIDALTVMAQGGRGRDTPSQTGALGGSAAASVGDVRFDGGSGGNGIAGPGGTGGGGGAAGGTTSAGQSGTLTVPGYAQVTVEGGHGGPGSLGAASPGVIPGGGGGSSGQDAQTSYASGANGSVRLTYVDPAVSQGTLSLDELEIENLVADNGLSTFSVVVALEADGVPNATPGAIVLDVVAVV